MRGGLGVASKITSSSSKLCKKSKLSSKPKKNETGINSPNLKFRSRNSKNCDSKCPLCNKTFKDFRTNVDHSCKPFKCNFCDETFSYDFQLNVHKCAEKEVSIREPNSANNSFQTSDVTFETTNRLSQQKKLCSKKYLQKFDMCRKIISAKNRDVYHENSKQISIKNKKYSPRFSKFNKNLSQSTSNNFASPSHLGVELSSSDTATISGREFPSCSQLTDSSAAATDDQVPETNSAENGNKSFPIEMESNQLENTRRKMFKRGNSNNNILISSLLKEKVDKEKVVNAKSFRVRNPNKKVTFSLNDNSNTEYEGNLTQPPSLNVRNKRKRSAATSKTLTSRSDYATDKVTNVIGENNDVVKKRKTDLLTSKQTDRCFESSKCSEPFSSESIVRELEVTESTLTSIPDEFDDFNKIESKSCDSTQYKEKGTVDLKCLKTVLDESIGALLRAPQGSNKGTQGYTMTNYLCPKCNKSCEDINLGVQHYKSCPSFKKTKLIVYDDLLFICLKCLFNSSEYSELTRHKKSCNNSTISNYIINYRTVNKHLCDKCYFSCLSDYSFSQHDCEEVLRNLKDIKPCLVQLTHNDKKACDDFIKFECSTCETVFYDELSYDKHENVCLKKNVKNAVDKRQDYVKKAKMKMIKNVKVYESTKEILEEFVEPFSQIELTADPQNTDFLKRDLIDATLPYQNQVLLKQVAKPIVEQEVKSMCKELGISSAEEEIESESHLHPPDALSPLRNFKCQCENKSKHLPEKDIKPCLKCLNKFVLSRLSLDSNENQTSTHNSFASVISDHLNQQEMPEIPSSSGSSSFSKLENSTSSGFSIPKVLLTAVNVEQSEMELDVVPSLNPSTDIAIQDNIVIKNDFLHNKVVEKALNDASNISEQHAGDSAEMCVNECYAGTSDKGIRQNRFSSICISSVRSQLLENIQSNDVNTVASCSNTRVSDFNSGNSQESVKDYNRTNSEITVGLENLSSVSEKNSQNINSVGKVQALCSLPQFPMRVKSPNSNVQNVCDDQRSTDSDDSGIELRVVNMQNYNEFLSSQINSKLEFDMEFELETVKVKAHTFFNKTKDNSVYCIKVTGKYYCAYCLDEIPGITLIQHLVEKHNDYDVKICVI